MNKQNRKRIVRELCQSVQKRLNETVTNPHWPVDFDGRHIRALFAEIAAANLRIECVKKAQRELNRSGVV